MDHPKQEGSAQDEPQGSRDIKSGLADLTGKNLDDLGQMAESILASSRQQIRSDISTPIEVQIDCTKWPDPF
jgi:hypothetical protein